MQHLFTPEGEAALEQLLDQRPLLAFDFDGTLAPIVPHPNDARIPPAIAATLEELNRHLPVAVITGRAVVDVRDRLGFAPRFIIGNHGAEDDADPDAPSRVLLFDPLRARLAARTEELSMAGILIEDKGQSMAWHYRQSEDPASALGLIEAMIRELEPSLQAYPGKMVVNIVGRQAPDKAVALARLVERSGAASAFFAGDDVNDEPVFRAAPPNWLTVRIGWGDPASKAHYRLDSPAEIGLLLERVAARFDIDMASTKG